VLSSFDPDAILKIRAASPGIRTALLTEDIGIDEAERILQRVGADLWAPDCKTVDDEALARCQQLRITLLPWSVDVDDDFRRLLSANNVAGIITDRTRRALEIRRKLEREALGPGNITLF
jgi:glycerophosphoryl diester phosphodiesterase